MHEEEMIEDEELRRTLGYSYTPENPLADEKESIFAFFKRVITKPLNIKTANLTDDELGNVKIPVRTNLEISSYCKNMKMSAFSRCFEDDAQVILGSSLSRGGFLDQLAVTTKKEARTEMTRKGQQQNQRGGWFAGRREPENLE